MGLRGLPSKKCARTPIVYTTFVVNVDSSSISFYSMDVSETLRLYTQ